MEEAFLAKGIPESRKVHNVSSYLGSAALQWYQNRKRNAELGQVPPITTWQEFVAAIKEAFQPLNQQTLLRKKLRMLKQKGSVQEYVFEFRNLMGQIEQMHELDQIQHFVEGLKAQTRAKVNYKAPPTLEEAIRIAVNYDSAMYGVGRYTMEPRKIFKNLEPSNSQVVPMELGAIQRQPTKEECKQLGLCFICFRKGHTARFCKNRPQSTAQKTLATVQQSLGEDPQEDQMFNAAENFMFSLGEGAAPLFYLDGLLNNFPIRVMIDSGASNDYISSKILYKIGASTEPTQASNLTIADGKQYVIDRITVPLKLKIGTFEEELCAYVFPDSNFDLILGQSWLMKRDPVISWRNMEMTTEKEGQTYHLKQSKMYLSTIRKD